MSNELLIEIAVSFFETLYMVFASCFFAVLLGLPLGILLFISKDNGLKANKRLFQCLSVSINIIRSIPFIILLVLLIPVTRFLVGSSIGSSATIVPLSIGAIPFFARIVENIFIELPKGLIEAGISFGATTRQIIYLILLPEALPALINGFTVTLITLVSYSAMAGAVGGGGLGALAINYGYQRFDVSVLAITVILLILLVQCFQLLGSALSKTFSH